MMSIDAQIANSAESGSALASGLTPMEEEALYRDIDQLDPENSTDTCHDIYTTS